MMLSIIAALAARPAACPVLPLATGRSWTYRARVSWSPAGSTTSRDTTITWTTRVLDVRTRDSIDVALVQDWPTALAWWEPRQQPDSTFLVCTGHRLYQVASHRGAPSALRDSLLAGRRLPAIDDLLLQLPLRDGDLYGRDRAERTDTYYAWYVEAVVRAPARLIRVGVRRTDSVYTVAYRTMPDHQIMDYVPGFGLTGYVFAHHGTVSAATAELVASGRAPSRRGPGV